MGDQRATDAATVLPVALGIAGIHGGQRRLLLQRAVPGGVGDLAVAVGGQRVAPGTLVAQRTVQPGLQAAATAVAGAPGSHGAERRRPTGRTQRHGDAEGQGVVALAAAPVAPEQLDARVLVALLLVVGGGLPRPGEVVAQLPPGIGVAELQLGVAALAVVEIAGGAGKIEVAVTAEGLAHQQVELVALLVAAGIPGVPVAQCVARAEYVAEFAVAFGGIAVAGQGQGSAGGLEGPAVVEPDAPALLARAILDACAGIGAVQAEGAEAGGEDAAAQHGQVVVGDTQSQVGGQGVAHAALVGEVGEQVVAVAILARLAQGEAVARQAGTHGLRDRGERHAEARYAAIGFEHLDIQIAGIGAVVEIVDDERTGGDIHLADLPAVLADHHPRRGGRGAAHLRRIAAQGLGQHAVVGSQAQAAVADAAEQVAGGVALPRRQFAAPGRQGALGIGADAVPLAPALPVVAGIGVVGLVAQTPQAEVDAAVQADIGVVRSSRFAAAVFGAIEVGVVVDEAHAVAGVPLLGADVAARLEVEQGLRHREIQAQAGDVQAEPRAGQACIEKGAVAPVAALARIVTRLGAEALAQEVFVEAGLHRAAGGVGAETHFAAAGEALVEVDIHVIATRIDPTVLVEARQVAAAQGRAEQQAIIEFVAGLGMTEGARRQRHAARHQGRAGAAAAFMAIGHDGYPYGRRSR